MGIHIEAFASRHGGVFTRQVALRSGLTDDSIRSRIESGRWHRVRRGVYCEAAWWSQADSAERHLAQAHAVALRCDGDLVFTHVTAAVAHGLPTWNVPLDVVSATRSGASHHGRVEARVHQFVSGFPPEEVVVIGGLRVSSLERLMVEVSREYGFEEAVVICDAAERAGAIKERARELFLKGYAWPRSAGVAQVIAFADGRAESPGESRLRVRLDAVGIEGYEPQQVLRAADGRFLGRGDLVNQERRSLVEFDGKSKYGIDDRDARDQLWLEKLREDGIRADGQYEVTRVTWAQLASLTLLGERIRAAERRAARRGLADPGDSTAA